MNTARFVLGAVFVYQLAVLHRHERGSEKVNVGMKPFLIASCEGANGRGSVLEALRREGGLTPGELARRFGVETPTVVRGVGRMEAAGLMVCRDDPQDGRLVRVYLTDRGRELEGIIPEAEDGVIDEAVSGLSRDERRQLNHLLSRVLENLQGG